MNFKTTLLLIILLSIITPVSIFLVQKDPQQDIESKRTFLYTIPEEEITSLTVENNDNIVEFKLKDDTYILIYCHISCITSLRLTSQCSEIYCIYIKELNL